MHSLLHDEHFRWLTVHLDGLGAQSFLAAARMREGGEVDAYLGLPPNLSLALFSILQLHSSSVISNSWLSIRSGAMRSELYPPR